MKCALRHVITLIACSCLALGQQALELEQQIPDWQSGEMNLYFDMAVAPDVKPDGSFAFAESMTELNDYIGLLIEIGEGYHFEDLYPWCFDDATDEIELSEDEVGYWGFRTARLNQRTDGTNDGTVELKTEDGSAVTFVYADRPVEVTGSCQLTEAVSAEFDLELAPEVRYVVGKAVDGQLKMTTDVTREDLDNAEWVAELN